MAFENAAVPFYAMGNKQVLFEEQLQNQPWLRDFVKAFPRCFEYDVHGYMWIFYPEGDAPQLAKEEKP